MKIYQKNLNATVKEEKQVREYLEHLAKELPDYEIRYSNRTRLMQLTMVDEDNDATYIFFVQFSIGVYNTDISKLLADAMSEIYNRM